MLPNQVWERAQELHQRRVLDNTQPLGGVYSFVADELAELERADNDVDRADEYGDLVAQVLALGLRLGLDPWVCAAASHARQEVRLDFIAKHAQSQPGSKPYRVEAAELWDRAKAQQSASLHGLAGSPAGGVP